jgi:DNA-binding NarL/FixJ family response regulator
MRILIADTNALMAEGIREALREEDDIEVVGEARAATEVLPLARRTDPDLVLIGAQMPRGFACLDELRADDHELPIVILGETDEPERVWSAFRRGASGYFLKSVNPTDLPAALRLALDRSVYVAPAAAAGEEAGTGETAAGLTGRELSILKAVAGGLSNQAIAGELWVTEQTVKFHLTNIYRKLDVCNRTQAARYAHQHGLT